VAIVLAAFVTGTLALPRWIDRYQFGRPRYAAERALRDLAAGRVEAARQEVQTALEADRPFAMRDAFGRPTDQTWEGRVMRERVLVYERLGAELFNAGQLDAAEEVLWKSQLEYHVASRVVEFVTPWELIYTLQAARGPQRGAPAWEAAFESARILAALGAERVRAPEVIEPRGYAIDPANYEAGLREIPAALVEALKRAGDAQATIETRSAALRLKQLAALAGNSTLRERIQDAAQRCLARGGDANGARDYYREIWGAPAESIWDGSVEAAAIDARALEWVWRTRPSQASPSIAQFLERFEADGRLRVLDWRGLARIELGYFSPHNRVEIQDDGSAMLRDSVAAALDFDTTAPVQRIYLAVEAKGVLDFYPILLARLDDAPYVPIYCDAPEPELFALDCELAAGRHRLEVVYLNDGGVGTRQALVASMRALAIDENREVRLHRFVLVQSVLPQ
jgi:hypothetical protein